MNTNKNLLPLVESQIKSLVKTANLMTVAVAINNVCCYGDILYDNGVKENEKALSELFDGIEKILSAAKKFK